MKVSEKGLAALKREEGCVLHVYKDQAGLLTIGIGHLLTKSERTSGKIYIRGEAVKYADGLTSTQALDLLAQDLIPAENCVNNAVHVDLSQSQFDALVSFTFNVGTGAFAGSTLLKELNRGNHRVVPEQLKRWVYAGGKICGTLAERRTREIKMWNGE